MKKSKTLFFIAGMAYPIYSIVDMTIRHIEQNRNVLYFWVWIILVFVPILIVLIRLDTTFKANLKSSLSYEAYILTLLYIFITILSYKSALAPEKDVLISLGASLLWIIPLQAGMFCWYFFRYRHSPYSPISVSDLKEIDTLLNSLEPILTHPTKNKIVTRNYLRAIVITGRLNNARQTGMQGKINPPDLQQEIIEIKGLLFLLQKETI